MSGTIEIADVKTDGGVDASTMSGDVRFRHVAARRVNGGSVSGDVRLEDIDSENVGAHSISGDIVFLRHPRQERPVRPEDQLRRGPPDARWEDGLRGRRELVLRRHSVRVPNCNARHDRHDQPPRSPPQPPPRHLRRRQRRHRHYDIQRIDRDWEEVAVKSIGGLASRHSPCSFTQKAGSTMNCRYNRVQFVTGSGVEAWRQR